MEKIGKIILLILLSCLGYFIYTFFPIIFPKNYCNKILTFKIENIDNRFGLSREQAINYAQSAAALWNKGLQKQVLKYDENGEIKISFVYDERQRKTIQNNILKEEAQEKTENLTQKNEDLKVQKENFSELKIAFEKDFKNFELDLENYNSKVASINKNGGATEEEIKTLDQEKTSLQNRQIDLENRQTQLNNYLTSINSNVNDYNVNVRQFNSVVQEINKNSLGEFEEGHFSGNEIVLYEYENATTLKRLLAHELGHALGLDHTKDKNSIMYYINQGDKFVLTKDDVEEYKKVCNVK